jgi:hypothetical protein
VGAFSLLLFFSLGKQCSTNIVFLSSHVKQSILYSVWKSIVQLRDSVTVRRIDVQLLQQELKLYYVLKEQVLG